MQAGEVALGMPVRLARSGDVARIAKTTGHDFIFIDCQHSLFNLETIGHIASPRCRLASPRWCACAASTIPTCRCCSTPARSASSIPDVANAAQAKKAVDICKFAPLGKRSVTAGYPQFDYRSVPLSESVPQLDDACLLVCMIETIDGLENVEDIAAVDGVDVLHLGSNDLLANMGKPGKFDDPVLVAAQEELIAACRKHGKFAGCGGNRDVARQVDLVRKGCLFLTTQSDIGFLSAAASAWTKASATA